MKNYYYVSEGIVKQFPELEKSKPLEGSFGICYIAVIPDFSIIEKFSENYKEDKYEFAYECAESLVDLTYEGIDYDDEGNEIEIIKTFDLESCRRFGLITAIEQELGISKEKNIAFVIYKLAKKANVTPIELINLI